MPPVQLSAYLRVLKPQGNVGKPDPLRTPVEVPPEIELALR